MSNGVDMCWGRLARDLVVVKYAFEGEESRSLVDNGRGQQKEKTKTLAIVIKDWKK